MDRKTKQRRERVEKGEEGSGGEVTAGGKNTVPEPAGPGAESPDVTPSKSFGSVDDTEDRKDKKKKQTFIANKIQNTS